MQSNLFAPLPPLSHFPSLSLHSISLCFYYQKFVTLKKNIQRQKQHQRNLQQWINSLARAPRESKRKRAQRTALPTPKEFRAAVASCCFGSARLLLLLLLLKFKDGNSGCWCSVLLSTSTRLDACSAGVSLAHSQLNRTLVNNYAVCVCLAVYACVCVRLSLLRVSVPPMPQETLS